MRRNGHYMDGRGGRFLAGDRGAFDVPEDEADGRRLRRIVDGVYRTYPVASVKGAKDALAWRPFSEMLSTSE